jgi:hypothetical protein
MWPGATRTCARAWTARVAAPAACKRAGARRATATRHAAHQTAPSARCGTAACASPAKARPADSSSFASPARPPPQEARRFAMLRWCRAAPMIGRRVYTKLLVSVLRRLVHSIISAELSSQAKQGPDTPSHLLPPSWPVAVRQAADHAARSALLQKRHAQSRVSDVAAGVAPAERRGRSVERRRLLLPARHAAACGAAPCARRRRAGGASAHAARRKQRWRHAKHAGYDALRGARLVWQLRAARRVSRPALARRAVR